MLSVLALPGAVPVVWGGCCLYPSVPWTRPQQGMAAHGPSHPALTIPLRFVGYVLARCLVVWVGYWFLVCFHLCQGSA